MASGDTLLSLFPSDNEPPASGYATVDSRNGHPVLDFDTTTEEIAIFTCLLPRNYAGGGITVYIHAALTSATTGTLGWLVAFERMDAGTNLDTDSFAADQTVTAATVPATSGLPLILNVAISNGANMDSIAAGDTFRLRIKRNVALDTAASDAELISVELKET